MNLNELRIKKKIGFVLSLFIDMRQLFIYLDCGVVVGFGEQGRIIIDIFNVYSDNSCII